MLLLLQLNALLAEAGVAPPPAPPATPAGGGFLNAYEQWRLAQERARRRRQREREAAEAAPDPVAAEIAAHLHAQVEAEAERADLERLRALVAAFEQEAAVEASERVSAARARAEALQTAAAFEVYARELARQLEEEEFLVMALAIAA